MSNRTIQRPTAAFVGALWVALGVGAIAHIAGLWNAPMALDEKGDYVTLLMYGLLSAVSSQKSVCDRLEGIPVTDLSFGLCWISLGLSLLLLTVGLWDAGLTRSEKAFYAMAFLLSLFTTVAVQKNVRNIALADAGGEPSEPTPGI